MLTAQFRRKPSQKIGFQSPNITVRPHRDALASRLHHHPTVACARPWRRLLKHGLRNPAHQVWPWRPTLIIKHLPFLESLLETQQFLRGEHQAATVILNRIC